MSHHKKCCAEPMAYGYGMAGMGGAGFGGGFGAGVGTGCGGNYGGWGIRWIYALLVLVVIVLQFGRTRREPIVASACGEDGVVAAAPGFGFLGEEGTIDRSVLFIIVVFLLILCAGCWTGGCNNYGSVGYGGGYGY